MFDDYNNVIITLFFETAYELFDLIREEHARKNVKPLILKMRMRLPTICC